MSFTYVASASDWARIAPLLVLVGMGLITLLADLFLPQGAKARLALEKLPGASIPFTFLLLPLLSLLGLAGALGASIVLFIIGDHQPAFYGMLASDQGTMLAYMIIASAAFLAVLLSPGYIKRQGIIHQGEYYVLLLLAALGMMLLAGAQSFLTIFVGIELLSLALYILCGYVARRASSQESGMKYFLLSSFASAFLLYGLALVYGATGRTQFAEVHTFLQTHTATSTLLFIGMGLLTVGFAFKISAVPFQAWTPDVYEGAPAPVTAFMSVGTKAAAIIAFARIFTIVLAPDFTVWLPAIWVITILTIVGGNLMALVQTNVKRMLGYSSIAHAGYLLIGIVAGGNAKVPGLGMSAILFYLFCYTFLNIGAFGVISVLERADNSGTNPVELRGLWRRQPVLAGLLAFFLFSLAGFPPMAGFAAKYYIFYAALVSGHAELLIIGVLASILGMYYYLRPIATMFMEREEVASSASSRAPGALSAQGKRPSGRLSTSRSGGVATAVVAKTVPATPRRTPLPVEETPVEEKELTAWPTKVALTLAVLGTLVMGTVVPFWLLPLIQLAAGKM
ncbi:MAG TPA: NADH-quinone oxidoreductase subunit N [Ktedonobacteraceae bacterium]